MAASTKDDRLASFSAYGKFVTVAAGGDKVVGAHYESNEGDDAYSTWSGTSFAAPLASGVAACMMSARPKWSPQCVKAAIVATSTSDILQFDDAADPSLDVGQYGQDGGSIGGLPVRGSLEHGLDDTELAAYQSTPNRLLYYPSQGLEAIDASLPMECRQREPRQGHAIRGSDAHAIRGSDAPRHAGHAEPDIMDGGPPPIAHPPHQPHRPQPPKENAGNDLTPVPTPPENVPVTNPSVPVVASAPPESSGSFLGSVWNAVKKVGSAILSFFTGHGGSDGVPEPSAPAQPPVDPTGPTSGRRLGHVDGATAANDQSLVPPTLWGMGAGVMVCIGTLAVIAVRRRARDGRWITD